MRPANIPLAVVTMMKIIMLKVFKCIWLMEDVYIGILRPFTIALIISEVIIVVMLVEVDIGHNIPATLPIAIGEHGLMLKVGVDIGLRPATLVTITHVTVVDCLIVKFFPSCR